MKIKNKNQIYTFDISNYLIVYFVVTVHDTNFPYIGTAKVVSP